MAPKHAQLQIFIQANISSNINEVIRAILNLFFFFLQEDFTHTKSTKRIQANKNKKGSIFLRIKNI